MASSRAASASERSAVAMRLSVTGRRRIVANDRNDGDRDFRLLQCGDQYANRDEAKYSTHDADRGVGTARLARTDLGDHHNVLRPFAPVV